MKNKTGNEQVRPSLHHSTTPPFREYSIRKHIGFWHLTFNGQKACFDHEQGAYYVAYLLLNPPEEPIHGMVLALKASAYFGRSPGVPGVACNTFITDPATGQTLTLGCYAAVVERNLCTDEAEGLACIRRKQEELEAILESETASEAVKAEVQQELEELPAQFVECNGQTLSDAASVYNGQVIPNLNGNNNFLRGNSTSGGTGGSSTHTHTVNLATPNTTVSGDNNNATVASANHTPPYVDMVWIIRIK